MSRARITRILMMLFVIMLTTVVAGAAQKKNNPPPAPKQAPAAKPAPAPRQAQPAARQTPSARVQPANGGVGQRSGTNAGGGGRVGGTNAGDGGRVGGTNAGGSFKDPRSARSSHTAGGGTLERSANNKPTHFVGSRGQEAHFSNKGNIRQVHDPNRNMTVQRGFRPGDRRVESVDRNNHRLVSMGPHRGFAERPYYRDHYGHAYVQRTYWAHGHAYAYAYRDHLYRGVHYYGYAPGHYYHPAFYGWAYHPWAAPVYYNWGWGPAAPWFYGGYFAPAPYYPTASLWLTDYLLSENLKQAYEAGQESQADAAAQGNAEAYQPGEQAQPQEGGSSAAAPMSPQVRAMIDAEVQRQLQAAQATAQSPQTQPVNDQAPPPALDPAESLFVVSASLGVSTAEGQECELTPGDVITRIDDNPGDDTKVKVRVMSSKPNDCGVGSMPRVAVTDLQEMHNNFRQQLDAGLDALAKDAGTGGLPKAPDTQTSAGQVPPPAPDPNVDTQLTNQQKDATQLEAEVGQEVQTAPAAANQ